MMNGSWLSKLVKSISALVKYPSNSYWEIDTSRIELGILGQGCQTKYVGEPYRHDHSVYILVWRGTDDF